jgi:hypothetical protein
MKILSKLFHFFGINLAVNGDIQNPQNGDMWYDSVTNKFKIKENNAVSNLVASNSSSIVTKEIEINFGTLSNPIRSWLINDNNVSTSNKILVYPSPNPGTDRIGNDWEFDYATFTATASNQSLQIYASTDIAMIGYRKIYYIIL